MGRVLACGLATVDVVHVVERVPGANEKVVALGTLVEAGGPALNAAVTATLLGMPATLVTAVGGSALAEVVRRDATAHGVDLVDTAGNGFAGSIWLWAIGGVALLAAIASATTNRT